MELHPSFALINTFDISTAEDELFLLLLAAKANKDVQDNTNCKTPSRALQVKDRSNNAGDSLILVSLHLVYCDSTADIALNEQCQ